MGIKHRHSSAAGLSAVALLISALAGTPAWSATPVATVLTRSASASAALSLDGALQPLRQATLSAQVGGNVVALLVKAGDRVKAGQPVARVDERELQAGVLRSEAGVAQAEAEWRNARLAADRARELRGQGFVSQAALDQAETSLKAAQAGVAQAQAGRTQASLARGFTTVSAPFDAVVLATHVEAGDLATPGRAIATIYAPGAMRAVVQVPASLAAAARGARQVQVELADGRRVTPVARQLLPGADAVSQTVEWRLELPAELATPATAASQPLLPGQQLRVHFEGAAPATAGQAPLVVPAAAVLRRGELSAVYVAQGTRFVLRAVRTGASRRVDGGDGIEILAGVTPGERLAADAVRAGLADASPAP